ncbi:MAG TPA: SRPBCC family protein [Candidatus Saccharimonadales bacterium]|nr:SRPBCC family protein [Candidatus Saccharimonadales bacterium]
MLKIVLIAVAVLFLAFALIALLGFCLPKSHVVSRAIALRQRPEAVFSLLSGFTEGASWRPELKRVEILPPSEGRQVFRETTGQGALTMEVVESRFPHRLVTHIVDRNLPFGGYWIYEVWPTAEGCRLNITERGEIYNPVFRFVARFFLGYTRTIDTYLTNVAGKFGETAPVTAGQPAGL